MRSTYSLPFKQDSDSERHGRTRTRTRTHIHTTPQTVDSLSIHSLRQTDRLFLALQPRSCGRPPLSAEVVQAGHQTEETDQTRVHAGNASRVQAVVDGDGHPVGGDHELVPPLAIEGLFLAGGLGTALALLDLGFAPQAEEVAGDAEQPGAAAPGDPLGDAAALLDDGHGHDALAGQVVDVLQRLEADVAEALQQGDAVQRRVHVGRRLARQQRLQPDVQRQQARQAQRRACVRDQRAERGEERRRNGAAGRRGRELRGSAADQARDLGDQRRAGRRLRVQVRCEVDGIVEGRQGGAEARGGFDQPAVSSVFCTCICIS